MKSKRIRVSRTGTRRVAIVCALLGLCLCACTTARTFSVSYTMNPENPKVDYQESVDFNVKPINK